MERKMYNCPRCKSKDWVCVDEYNGLKVLRCLSCRRKYTIEYKFCGYKLGFGYTVEIKRVWPRDVFYKERTVLFRARCPGCGSYCWYTTRQAENKCRDYYCGVCRLWYRLNFGKKEIYGLQYLFQPF